MEIIMYGFLLISFQNDKTLINQLRRSHLLERTTKHLHF